MTLADLLRPERIVHGLRVRDKTQLLEELAQRAARSAPVPAELIAAALTERERLGSTGLGKGFALPHTRLAALDDMFGLLVTLARPIDFDSIDGKPVDVLFLLLMPEEKKQEHVAALAAVARAMREPMTLSRIRASGSASALYETMIAVMKSEPGSPS